MGVDKIIKSRRLELGLTLKDVADALGVAESTILRYETSDIKNMGIDKVEALAKILECSPEYLLGWKNSLETSQIRRLDEYAKRLSELSQDKQAQVFSYIDFLEAKNDD